MIYANEISKKVGRKPILSEVNASFDKGKLSMLIGPNGAGKSTLIRILAGMDQASSGQVYYGDVALRAIRNRDRALMRAILSQQNPVSAPFKVDEVVMMGRYPFFHGAPRKVDFEIADQAMEMTGVTHLRNRVITTLSGGEQQRTHLARVLCQLLGTDRCYERKILFLDEPVNALDLPYQHQVLQLALHIAAKGAAVVAVVHDLNMAFQYGQAFTLLKNGRLFQAGAKSEVMTAHILSNLYGMPIQVLQPNGVAQPIITAGQYQSTYQEKNEILLSA